jgi:hypothetical protein
MASESDAVCICKKKGLRHMYFMRNKNMTDIIDRATTGTVTVGKYIAQLPRELCNYFCSKKLKNKIAQLPTTHCKIA